MNRTKHPFLPVMILAIATSCTTYRAHKGEEDYQLMSYEKAERLLGKVNAERPTRKTLLMYADACRRQNHLAAAATGYLRADSIGELTGYEAFRMGQVLMGLGRHEEARTRFLRVLQDTPEDATAMALYRSCEGYLAFFADSARFVVNRLNIPGLHSAFSPVRTANGLMVAGERSAAPGRSNPWNGASFLDLYHVRRNTLVNLSPAEPLRGDVNGAYHDGPALLTKDGRTLYFTRSNYFRHRLQKDDRNTSHLKLFRAILDSAGEWRDIRAFAHNGETFSTGHPALSADGRTLYFASDRPGGYGGSDIWRCRWENGGWGQPENLGPVVNTPGNELFPVMNGDVLHFSSTAHMNLGGLDIFESREENGQWTAPRNLNYPINSTHDDFSFVLDTTLNMGDADGPRGYLSSDREGTDQVYTFWSQAPLFFVEGLVSGEYNQFLPNAEVVLTDLATLEDTVVLTDKDGRFLLPLGPNKDYNLRAQADMYLERIEKLSTRGLTRSDTLHTSLRLAPVVFDQPVALKNILFDYDQWDIRPDAARELDKLAAVMIGNPELIYELDAHTDSRGGDTYNLVLSDARANSAVNYLIHQGVDPARISARGYGETTPVNHCRNGVKCTEEEHQANRRVEFRVTGIRYADEDQ